MRIAVRLVSVAALTAGALWALTPAALAQGLEASAVVSVPTVHGTALMAQAGMTKRRPGYLRLLRGPLQLGTDISPDGTFELPVPVPGRYRATIFARGSTCTTDLDIPNQSSKRIDAGVLVCRNALPDRNGYATRP
jgi:hypothetical protein